MFIHTHLHTEYSILDGQGKIEEYAKRCVALGMPGFAITDHGATSGHWEAQKIAEKYNIKIIKGTEFYAEREDGKLGHIIALAMNDKGLENMYKLQEHAYVENFKRKPRVSESMLFAHNEGLIVTSACLANSANQHIMNGDIGKATKWLRDYKEVFGDRFYIEIQPNNIPEQVIVNKELVRLAKILNIKVVAANDVHYVNEDDWYPHEVMLALQTNKKWDDKKRFRFTTQDFWFKSEGEMKDGLNYLDADVVHAALHNTGDIFNRCDSNLHRGKYLPHYHGCKKEEERQTLVNWIKKGVASKGYSSHLSALQHEIDVVDRNGYSGYFLIVADYVQQARKNNIIVGDGRGSGAGSKIAYVTDITKIDPAPYNLLFERFMADGREPDFDVDFSDQEAVIEYLCSKYGEDSVARIIAFGTMPPKAVTRKVLNCFGVSQKDIKKINSFILSTDETIEEALEREPQLRNYAARYENEFDLIKRLQNRISHESQHAGGVIIYPNLSSLLPVKTIGANRNRRIVTFDKYMLEEIGHFKFDILGLKTLPMVRHCLDTIKEVEGIEVDLHGINYEDPAVYDMLASGDVSGIFQLSNQAAKVMEQNPKNFRDLIAINALIRPGVGDWKEYIARRQGKEYYTHPSRQSYMEETVGTMTYQEQFLLDAVTFAGWEVAYADKHIRKNKSIRTDSDLRDKFIRDSVANQFDRGIVETIWKEIEDAVDGGYSFNKSHSASYAMLSYQTAYLKCHYPTHFYASLMTIDGDDNDAVAGYIAEAKSKGITILPPDINESKDTFVPTKDGIRYRITTIKNVGDNAIKFIRKNRPFESFEEFLNQREKKYINKTVIKNLIKAGAFDYDTEDRSHLLWLYDQSERTKTAIKKGIDCDKYTYNPSVKLAWEKEALGMYLSAHPMDRYSFKALDEYPDGTQCLAGGEIIKIAEITDKNSNKMAFVTLSTKHGNVKVVVFASSWEKVETKYDIEEGNIIMVRGKRSGDSVLYNSSEILS